MGPGFLTSDDLPWKEAAVVTSVLSSLALQNMGLQEDQRMVLQKREGSEEKSNLLGSFLGKRGFKFYRKSGQIVGKSTLYLKLLPVSTEE